jgi:hypothetical protein
MFFSPTELLYTYVYNKKIIFFFVKFIYVFNCYYIEFCHISMFYY